MCFVYVVTFVHNSPVISHLTVYIDRFMLTLCNSITQLEGVRQMKRLYVASDKLEYINLIYVMD